MKSSAMRSSSISMAVLLMAGILLFIATTSHAAPHIPGSPYYSSLSYEGQNPEYILQTLARLRQALIAEEDLENSPKLVDFGIGRGQSGSIEAIQRMAMNSGIAPDDLKNSKRGLDLGLGRGFSGSQAAKHLMGLAAANFAGSPGRRRRSDEEA